MRGNEHNSGRLGVEIEVDDVEVKVKCETFQT